MSLPGALEQNPRLSSWVTFVGDKVVVHTGKVELGQGISTAIAMIAAEELDLRPDQVVVKTGNTHSGPNEFLTAGSMSVEGSGTAMRQACAEVRAHLLRRAAIHLGVDVNRLTIEEGIIRHIDGNETVSYFELVQDEQLEIDATGEALPKAWQDYRLIGRSMTRVDLARKFTGAAAYVQDLRPEGLLHGRIVRPPGNSWRMVNIDTGPTESIPGVLKVVVDGSFVGVVANDEYTASRAKQQLEGSIKWRPDPDLALPGDIHDYLMNHADVSLPVVDGTPTEDPLPPRQTGNDTLRAIYKKPYHMHGSIGPSAALARFDNGKLHIYSHSQGPHVIRAAIAVALGMDTENVTVDHAENAGCYGHNGADDAAMDAAMLARALPGHPVLLKWERRDEHAWEPYSPAMALAMEASVESGKVTHWNADVYSQTHSGRPMPHRSVSNLIAAWHKADPLPRPEARPGMGNHTGIHRNADPLYAFPHRRITKNLVKDQRVRTSSTRGLGAFGNVFAIESFMDELARHSGIDPVEFRLGHLQDPRAAAVLNKVRELANAHSPTCTKGCLQGLGYGFAQYKNRQTYAAVAIFCEVNETTFEIHLRHGIIVADAGQVIDADGVANQLEGGLLQSASWTLKEAVTFDEFSTSSTDWESYPILRFTEVPTVEVHLLDHPELPPLGAGEATQGPTPAAIANAIFDATGLRIREIPFTPDNLRRVALGEQS